MPIPPAAAVLLALLLLPAAPADAKHRKPVSASYDVTLPLPVPVEGASHCEQGMDGTSRDTRGVVLPDAGRLDVELTGFLGDWVVELVDAKGRVVGQGASFEPANTEQRRKLAYKKGTKGQRLSIVVCNLGGTPRGTVRWVFTFAR